MTKWYPGRVYFVFFNVAIALVLMEANMFGFLNKLLGFYSNVAIAWIGAVVADLVINKPLLKTQPVRTSSSSGPTCTTSTRSASARWCVASAVSIVAYFGASATTARRTRPFIALFLAWCSRRCSPC